MRKRKTSPYCRLHLSATRCRLAESICRRLPRIGSPRGPGRSAMRFTPEILQCFAHEDCNLEREWDPRTPGAVLRVGGARLPGRGVPAGAQGRADADSRAMQGGRLRHLLA